MSSRIYSDTSLTEDSDVPLKKPRRDLKNNSSHDNPVDGQTQGSSRDVKRNVGRCSEKQHSCNCLKHFLSTSDDWMNTNVDDDLDHVIPYSSAEQVIKEDNYYMHKWQARQLARAFIDNTINSVLESSSVPREDAQLILNSCMNDDQVENDAISMAIQEHGLQSQIESFEDSSCSNVNGFRGYISDLEGTSNNNRQDCSLSRQNIVLEENIQHQNHDMDFMHAAVSVAIEKKGLSYGF